MGLRGGGPRVVGSLRDREVACSASDRQGSNFESCVWRTMSSQSFHHPREALLAQFSVYVHKGGLKPDSFHLFMGLRPCNKFHSFRAEIDIRRHHMTSKVGPALEWFEQHSVIPSHYNPLKKLYINPNEDFIKWYGVNTA